MKRSPFNILFFLVFVLPAFSLALAPISERSLAAELNARPTLESQLKDKNLQYGAPLYIRIFKESKEFEVWVQKNNQYEYFKTYPIYNYGPGKLGPKLKEGDWQAPEGFYSITPQSMNPKSQYHLSFNLGFPNQYDRSNGRTGSNVLIHGDKCSIGCFAMTDPVIEEIYTLAAGAFNNGQKTIPVHIFPFRFTEDKVNEHKTSIWAEFWNTLKNGYDYFETTHIPPTVMVKDKKYVLLSPVIASKN